MRPPQGLKKQWTRRGIAEWLVARLSDNEPAIVGIDHGFSADTNSNGTPDGCETPGGETGRCDWNDSDILSVQDIFEFLARNFAGNGDFNQHGATSTQDSFDYLT